MKYIFKYLYFVRRFKTCHSAFSGFVISPSGGKTHEKKKEREERVKKKIIRDEKLFNRRDKNVVEREKKKKQPPIHRVNQRGSAQRPPELSLKAKLLLLI